VPVGSAQSITNGTGSPAFAGQGEAVADRDQVQAHPVVRVKPLVESPNGAGDAVVPIGFGHRTTPQYVVHGDPRRPAATAQDALVVVPVLLLVGIDEGDVEGDRRAPSLQGGQGVERWTQA